MSSKQNHVLNENRKVSTTAKKLFQLKWKENIEKREQKIQHKHGNKFFCFHVWFIRTMVFLAVSCHSRIQSHYQYEIAHLLP